MGMFKQKYITYCPRCACIFSSEQGSVCPFCGFENTTRTNRKWSVFERIVRVARDNPEVRLALQAILNSAKSSPHYDPDLDRKRQIKQQESWVWQPVYTPRCPTCGSPDLSRAKIYFSFYPSKTYHCNNCGYEW